MQLNQNVKKLFSWRSVIILILITTTIISGVILIKEYKVLQRMGILKYPPQHRRELPKIISIDEIKPWMTFDYLNKQFGLPDDYLKNSLRIDDPTYPFIPIDRFFKKRRIDPKTAVETIKQSIRERNTDSFQPTNQ